MVEVGQKYNLPAGHAWQQPAMAVTVVEVRPNEWVAYRNDDCGGCSRYDYFLDGIECTSQEKSK